MSLPATDDFNRADAADLGANWTNMSGFPGMRLLSNKTQPSTATGDYSFSYWNADSFNSDHYSQAKSGGGTVGQAVILARASGSEDCYLVLKNYVSGACTLFKRASGSFTQLQSYGTPTINAGDLMRIEAEGSSIRFYIAGVQQGTTATDSALATGSAGIGGNSNSSNGEGQMDDWEGGNLSVAAGGAIVFNMQIG